MSKSLRLLLRLALRDAAEHRFEFLGAVLSATLAVLVAIAGLSLSYGFQRSHRAAGSDSVALVLAQGALAELNSVIDARQLGVITSLQGSHIEGAPSTVSPELYAVVNGLRRGESVRSNVALRGLTPEGRRLRESTRLIEGQWANPGAKEVAVGEAIWRQYNGFSLGETIRLGSADWRVVGVFTTGGSVADSELWSDLDSVRDQVSAPGAVQSVRIKLPDSKSLGTLAQQMAQHAVLKLRLTSERGYYDEQAREVLNLMRRVGLPLALVMTLGAVLSLAATMHNSLLRRMPQYRMLRMLGMSMGPMAASYLIEALALSLAGAGAAAGVATVLLDGVAASSIGRTFTQVVFSYDVGGQSLLPAVVLSIALAAAAYLPTLGILRSGIQCLHGSRTVLT